jgi:hypothetical protein
MDLFHRSIEPSMLNPLIASKRGIFAKYLLRLTNVPAGLPSDVSPVRLGATSQPPLATLKLFVLSQVVYCPEGLHLRAVSTIILSPLNALISGPALSVRPSHSQR